MQPTPQEEANAIVGKAVHRPRQRRLPDERRAIVHKFSVGGHEGFLTVGMYEDGALGEVFIAMAKEGSTISGLMDSFAFILSCALQYGVPLKILVDRFAHVRFEPSGWTGNPELPYAKSIMDYIFRWLGSKFLGPEYRLGPETAASPLPPEEAQVFPIPMSSEDAPLCAECGELMTRNGSVYQCLNCGGTSSGA